MINATLKQWEKERGLDLPLLEKGFVCFLQQGDVLAKLGCRIASTCYPLFSSPALRGNMEPVLIMLERRYDLWQWYYVKLLIYLQVARLNKTTLEEYMKANVWGPLGLTSTTYHPELWPDWDKRQGIQYFRNERGGVDAGPVIPTIPAPYECAGHGIFSTANDHLKLLAALLDDGGPLISRESVDELFKTQLPNDEALWKGIGGSFRSMYSPSIPDGEKMNHGLGGLINHNDFKGARKAGSLQWSGGPNLIWV
jgi:hypothetical protein